MRGDGDQQSGWRRGSKRPPPKRRPTRLRRSARYVVRHVAAWRARLQIAAGCDQPDEGPETEAPEAVLRVEGESWLDQERIGQKREETADIRRRGKEIRIAGVAMLGTREPSLKQRIAGRQCEKRQSQSRQR